MSNKILTAKVVVALDEHRQRTIDDLETSLVPFTTSVLGAQGFADLKILIDRYKQSLLELEEKLEALL